MKIEFIESVLIGIIILIQLTVFLKTNRQIGIFKKIIPEISKLSVVNVKIPTHLASILTPQEMIRNWVIDVENINSDITYQLDDEGQENDINDHASQNKPRYTADLTLSLIHNSSYTNKIGDTILNSINKYLIRNRSTTADFHIIKDIVERNTDTVEQDINLTLGIPLYLGLLGTMFGIVIALFNMPDIALDLSNLDTGNQLDGAISMLIGGVKIAMIASFTGLLLTIINSGQVFKGSRLEVERKKNDFYTFIQVELLPVMNQGLSSALELLQRNLTSFNSDFSSNIQGLHGIFDSNAKAITSQKELFQSIEKINIAQITSNNVRVLKQLDISVAQLERFNSYLTNVNTFVDASQKIVSNTNSLLERTSNFEVIANKVENNIHHSVELLEFLSKHFNDLEEYKSAATETVAYVGHSMKDVFKELETHIYNSSQSIKDFTVEELIALKTALSESKTNLGNLEHLATLTKDVAEFKTSSEKKLVQFELTLVELNKQIKVTNHVLEQIKNKRSINPFGKLIKYFKNKFEGG